MSSELSVKAQELQEKRIDEMREVFSGTFLDLIKSGLEDSFFDDIWLHNVQHEENGTFTARLIDAKSGLEVEVEFSVGDLYVDRVAV